MLQGIRDILESQKWLTYVVLGALAVIFAAWGAYGIVNLSFGAPDYAAKAGGEEISVQEAREAWQRQQSQWQQRLGGDIPAQEKAVFQDQMLESMVRDLLMSQRSHDLGYRVSEDDLRKAVQAIPRFQVGGQYSAEAAKSALQQAGISIDTFESQMRSSLQRQQIEDAIAISDFVTAPELQRMRALEDEQREVRYAVLPADKFAAAAKIDDAAVQAYYKAHSKDYMTPELANLQYGELRLAQVAAQETVSEEDLKAEYEKNKSKYVNPEQRRAQHILISVADPKDDATALKQAQQVLADAKAGKDFGQLAKQYSKDPGSADQGGELGWVSRDALEKPFADALFSMMPGEIRGPVKTRFGYHIIKLEEIQPAKVKTFQEVRPELEADLKRNRAADRFGQIQEELQSKLQEPDANFDALVKEYHLQTGDVPQFLRGSGGGELAGVQPLQDLVFGDSPLGVGKVGGPVLAGEDRLIIVKVLDRKPPTLKPLTEVHDSIVAELRKEAGTQAAVKAADEAAAKLQAGASFDTVVKDLGVTAEPAKYISRSEASVPAQVLSSVFAAPKPSDGKPVYRTVKLNTGGAAIYALTNIRTKPEDKNLQAETAYRRQEAARLGDQAVAGYIDEVRRTSTVKKNLAALD
jgi:peptidyl-prolyl cis-trans isomerase D